MKYAILFLMGFVLIGYQNCDKGMRFSTNNDKVSDGNFDEINGNSDYYDGGLVETPVDDSDGVDSPEDVDDPSHEQSQSAKLGYVCILEGAGKSQKLAYVDEGLISKNATPKTVCTTERGCLEIASQKFNVIGVEYRGYCKNSKAHTLPLSEEELFGLIQQ